MRLRRKPSRKSGPPQGLSWSTPSHGLAHICGLVDYLWGVLGLRGAGVAGSITLNICPIVRECRTVSKVVGAKLAPTVVTLSFITIW